jgi:hypothetical protein
MTPLHVLGNFFRDLLLRIPLEAVRVVFVFVPLALLVWVWTLPRSQTTRPGRESRWDENLKLWASIALVIQVLIYSLV